MNGTHEILSKCQRRMIDDNRDWLDKNRLKVVKSSVEEDPKYGTQLIIIVQEIEADPNPPA